MAVPYTVSFDNRIAGIHIRRNSDKAFIWLTGREAAEFEHEYFRFDLSHEEMCAAYDDQMTIEETGQ